MLSLEQYLDNLQTLPGEVQRNLRLIRELDEKVSTAMRRVDELGAVWVKDEEKWSADEKRKRKAAIQDLINKSKSWSEEKWQISVQLYEMVDKHIRRLDGELARFEKDLKRKVVSAKLDFESGAEGGGSDRKDKHQQQQQSQQPPPQSDIKPKLKGRKSQSVVIKDESSASENAPPSKKRKKQTSTLVKCEMGGGGANSTTGQGGPATPGGGAGRLQPISPGGLGAEQLASLSGAALIQQLVGVSTGVMDMPIDPNEPVYCTCRQVSYGEMVGCDNGDCPIEWFHFGCVGITTKPKGKWFCPMCKDAMAKKKASPSR